MLVMGFSIAIIWPFSGLDHVTTTRQLTFAIITGITIAVVTVIDIIVVISIALVGHIAIAGRIVISLLVARFKLVGISLLVIIHSTVVDHLPVVELFPLLLIHLGFIIGSSLDFPDFQTDY